MTTRYLLRGGAVLPLLRLMLLAGLVAPAANVLFLIHIYKAKKLLDEAEML